MTIEISREEFVKRSFKSIPKQHYLYSKPKEYEVNRKYEYEQIMELNMVLLDRSGWEKLKEIIEEIVWLYKEYGLTDDSMLTKYAQYLKERILEVKDDFRLEKLQRIVEGNKE